MLNLSISLGLGRIGLELFTGTPTRLKFCL
jgi:hypothetical protein